MKGKNSGNHNQQQSRNDSNAGVGELFFPSATPTSINTPGSSYIHSPGVLRRRYSAYLVKSKRDKYEPYYKEGKFIFWQSSVKPQLPFTKRHKHADIRGIDKITISLDRIFFNEDLLDYNLIIRDWISTRFTPRSFLIEFHGEFFSGMKSPWEEMRPVLQYFFEKGLFRIPIRFKGRNKILQKHEDYGIKGLPETREQMFQIILSKFKMKEVELKYDIPLLISDLPPLPRNFKEVGSTLYSPDAKNKRSRKSLVCVYDKGEKYRKERRVFHDCLTRIEFRLTGDYVKGLCIADLMLGFSDFMKKVEEVVGRLLVRKRKYRLGSFLNGVGLGYLVEGRRGVFGKVLSGIVGVIRKGSPWRKKSKKGRGGYIKAISSDISLLSLYDSQTSYPISPG